MTPAEFGMQMDRLKILYSEKSFPEERIKVMWARYSRFPGRAFTLAVDWVVLTMPSPGQVVVALDDKLAYAKPEASGDGPREIQYDCAACRDWGWVWDDNGKGDLIVHCTCPKAASVSWEELKRHQDGYDKGKRFLKTPADLAKFLGRGA
jgi:hypothetical protein